MRFRAALVSLVLALLACAAMAAEPVNINEADAATLAAAITGVGDARAEAIVAFRAKHGPFKSVDDLLLVRGIGAATLEQNRDRLMVAD